MTTTDPFGTPDPLPRDRNDVDSFSTPGGIGRPHGDAEDRAEIPRDQWDRYLMHQLDGSKPAANKGMTRVSTSKSALSNTVGIQRWAGRRILSGIGKDAKLVEQAMRAAALTPGPDQEKALGRIADLAYEIGGGKERAGLGTQFHQLTEDRNKGLEPEIPEVRLADIAAYYRMLSDNFVEILPEFLERQVLCPFNHGGTFDNIVRWWDPVTEEWELVVADLKTGRSLDLGWLEILIQLWLYANAYAIWTTTEIERNDPKDSKKITGVQGFYTPMPHELRRDKALIFHVPLDGTASLYVLDLGGVETWVRAAVEARRANSEAKHKVRCISTFRPDAFVAPTIETRQGVVVVPADQGPVDQFSSGPFPTTLENAANLRFMPGDAGLPDQVSSDGGQTWTNQPTADQLEQQAILERRQKVAAETLARAAAVAPGQLPGDNTSPPPPIERDPVTGRKKRTCGHCHKPGHTQKNCPENPASPKYVKPELRAAPDLPEYKVGDTVTVEGIEFTKHSDGPMIPDQDAAPYCLQLDHTVCEWTSQPPAAHGTWGCSITGKPSKGAYEAGKFRVTALGPAYGHPDGAAVAHLNPTPQDLADGDDAPPPSELAPSPWPAPPTAPDWVTPPDMVAWGITNSHTVDVLLAHRASCIAAGTWTVIHDEQGKIRYQALTSS